MKTVKGTWEVVAAGQTPHNDNKNPMGLQVSRVSDVAISDEARRITQSEKNTILEAIGEALQNRKGVINSALAIQINNMKRAYADSIGLKPQVDAIEASRNSTNKFDNEKDLALKKLKEKYDKAMAEVWAKHKKQVESFEKAKTEAERKWQQFVVLSGIVPTVRNGYDSDRISYPSGFTIRPTAESSDDSLKLHQAIIDIQNSEQNMSFSKLSMRIALSTTVGEVADICRAVLGNSVLPDKVENQKP